jgi:hypothetical protein
LPPDAATASTAEGEAGLDHLAAVGAGHFTARADGRGSWTGSPRHAHRSRGRPSGNAHGAAVCSGDARGRGCGSERVRRKMEGDGRRHLRRVAPWDSTSRPRNSCRGRAQLTRDGRAHRSGGKRGPIERRVPVVCQLRLRRAVRRGGTIAGDRHSRRRLGQLAAAAEAELVVVLVFFAAAVAGNHRHPR